MPRGLMKRGGGVHVKPSKSEGKKWIVENNGKEQKGFNTQVEAIKFATKQAKAHKTELTIHGRDGKIREKNSFGKDPFPPKG